MLGSDHPVILHRVAHLQGRVHQDAVVAIEHLGIHASHRRADNQIRLLRLAHLPQQVHRLLRANRKVGGNHRCIWKYLADSRHRSTLSRRCEAVYIHDLLSPEKLGILLDIRIRLFHHKRIIYLWCKITNKSPNCQTIRGFLLFFIHAHFLRWIIQAHESLGVILVVAGAAEGEAKDGLVCSASPQTSEQNP